MHPVRAIVGLGNPGPDYAQTRHNIGFDVLDRFAESARGAFKDDTSAEAAVCQVSVGGQALWLIKPLTFMNRSGKAVGSLARKFRWEIASIVVVYDDLTLDVARLKISLQGSAGGHNGIADILTRLGNGFIRFRIGVGAKSNPEQTLADHVLSPFSLDERQLIESRHGDYQSALQFLIRNGPEAAMNLFNQRPKL